MRVATAILVLLCAMTCTVYSLAQNRKGSQPKTISQPDTVVIPKSQAELFLAPKKNILTTHADLCIGAGRTARTDQADLSFAGTVKGLYMLTGALYVNMGVGVTRLNSMAREDNMLHPGSNKAMVASFPLGVGFTMGDDRAQVINNIDFLPVYYVDNPPVKRQRTFTYGVGVDLGFHIRIKQRLHMGMIGKLQLFEPFDKDEPQSFPRYGFIGAGMLLRYD